MAHGDGGLDAGGDGVDAGAEAEEVEFFVLFADGVLGVDFGDVGVVLLDGLVGGGGKGLAWWLIAVGVRKGLRFGKGGEMTGGITDFFELVLLGSLVFACFGGLAV